LVRDLEEVGYPVDPEASWTPGEEALEPLSAYLPSWRLWEALVTKYAGLSGEELSTPWRPFGLSVGRAARPAGGERLELRFPFQISQKALIQFIRASWPEWKEEGLVHARRPLSDKAVALLRLVTLELPPEITWRERLEVWNERYPDWAVGNVRHFQRGFRRYEEQLTGQQYGLEWAYAPETLEFEQYTAEDVRSLLKEGGPKARRFVRQHAATFKTRYEATVQERGEDMADVLYGVRWAQDVLEEVKRSAPTPDPASARLHQWPAEKWRWRAPERSDQ